MDGIIHRYAHRHGKYDNSTLVQWNLEPSRNAASQYDR